MKRDVQYYISYSESIDDYLNKYELFREGMSYVILNLSPFFLHMSQTLVNYHAIIDRDEKAKRKETILADTTTVLKHNIFTAMIAKKDEEKDEFKQVYIMIQKALSMAVKYFF